MKSLKHKIAKKAHQKACVDACEAHVLHDEGTQGSESGVSSDAFADDDTGISVESPSSTAGLATFFPCFNDFFVSPAIREVAAREIRTLCSEHHVAEDTLFLGKCISLDRGFPLICTKTATIRCEFSALLTKSKSEKNVVVGDWLIVGIPCNHAMGIMYKILPRVHTVSRWRGDSRAQMQVLAAHVDKVLLVQPFTRAGLDLARIVRTAVIAQDCGCSCAVVCTKVDRVGLSQYKDALMTLSALLANQIEIVVSSQDLHFMDTAASYKEFAAEHGVHWGASEILQLVGGKTCAMLLGESGAGKSSLLNLLLKRPVQRVGATRSKDDSGRHTTVSRQMIALPSAGCIIDCPGLRTLPLMGHEAGLAQTFPLLTAAVEHCKFRNCSHKKEPGCAVRALESSRQVFSGSIDIYVALLDEMNSSAHMLDKDISHRYI